MRLRLKEDQREWRKFGLVLVLVLAGLGGLAWGVGWVPEVGFQVGLGVLAAALAAGALRPRWIRPLYRGAMTASFYAGQVMGRVVLVLIFFVLVIPLGWCLRLLGKDLLHLRRQPQRTTYWEAARPAGSLDRLF